LLHDCYTRMETAAACDACGCFKSNLLRCSQCKIVLYCGKDCQRTAWCSHKKRCSILSDSVSVAQSNDFRSCEDTSFFLIGEMCESSNKRYLSTIHVLTCFVLFVRDPFSGRSIAAHIHMGAILHSINNTVFLPGLAERLASFREGCVVYIIGGHRSEDRTCMAMQFYSDTSISSHIRSFVKNHLPLAHVNEELLLKFNGNKIKTFEDEWACLEAGDRFEILSLDTVTGHVTWDNRDPLKPRCENSVMERQNVVFRKFSECKGLCHLVVV